MLYEELLAIKNFFSQYKIKNYKLIFVVPNNSIIKYKQQIRGLNYNNDNNESGNQNENQPINNSTEFLEITQYLWEYKLR